MSNGLLQTGVNKLLNIKHPVILAGMNAVAHAELVAAVSNAGGLGVIGGLTMTPKMLRQQLEEVKANLDDPDAFMCGVDLAIPLVGGARKTSYDYTKGKLPELIDIMIEFKVKLFVCAVGVPPKWAIEKLQGAGIPVMNMVGSPRNTVKAIEAGVDMICAQGGEGGGHTGEIATSVLIPQVVDICKNHTSPLLKIPIPVIAAGGIFDGRGLAMALSLGAQAVWVGTRFIAAKESAARPIHIEAVLTAKPTDTIKTLVYSGRPLRTKKTDYVLDWENNRAAEIAELCSKGTVPFDHDTIKWDAEDKEIELDYVYPLLMGQASAAITKVESAREIVENMVSECISVLQSNTTFILAPKL